MHWIETKLLDTVSMTLGISSRIRCVRITRNKKASALQRLRFEFPRFSAPSATPKDEHLNECRKWGASLCCLSTEIKACVQSKSHAVRGLARSTDAVLGGGSHRSSSMRCHQHQWPVNLRAKSRSRKMQEIRLVTLGRRGSWRLGSKA